MTEWGRFRDVESDQAEEDVFGYFSILMHSHELAYDRVHRIPKRAICPKRDGGNG
jgi:hypothetical protein